MRVCMSCQPGRPRAAAAVDIPASRQRCSAPPCRASSSERSGHPSTSPAILEHMWPRACRAGAEEGMSWPGRSHLAAALVGVPEGERVTVCGWVDRYRSVGASCKIHHIQLRLLPSL